ncbi:MAG: type II secretion system F family protein [Phycisphaeraceae bacterium]|nr:type II secretion system F family protein [Phycisphaeraceae bacterium]
MSALSFQYVAVDRQGKRHKGITSANDQQDAFRRVTALGMTPVKIMTAKSASSTNIARSRISPEQIGSFCYELAVLLRAAIPIAEGLRSIAEQEPKRGMRNLVTDMAAKIQAGSTITDAMAPHRKVFGDVFVETVRAAEKSGTLVASLEHLAAMLEQQAESSKQLKQAMVYPALITIALGGAATFLIAVIVPKFASMYAARGIELPFLTRLLQSVGESMQSFWWLYIPGFVAAVFGLRAGWRHPKAALHIDRVLSRIPYINKAIQGVAVARFARILGISLGSGLSLIESLEMAGRSTGRPLLIRESGRMALGIRAGDRLGDMLRTSGYLPPFARRMLTAGEESAELTKLCGVVANHYQRESAHLVKNAATVIEPVLIAVLTGVILVIALAIFLPMWDMVSLVG